MDAQPSSPKGQLRKDKKIFVRGADTIIRISPNAVILQTTREEGITFPDDMDEIEKIHATEEDTESGTVTKTKRVEKESAVTEEQKERKTPANIQEGELISDEKLRKLSRHLGKEWRTLALMHFDISNTDVDNITRNTSELPESIFQVLSLWRSREGPKATVENLVEKLKLVVRDKSKWEFLLNSNEEAAREEDVSEDPSNQNIASGGSKENLEPFQVNFSSEGSEPMLSPPKNIPSILLDDFEQPNDPSRAGAGAGSNRLGDQRQNAYLENQQLEPIIGADKTTDDKTLEDIERVSAVFAGFAEDKKDEFTSLGASMGELLQKILTLDHENKRLKTLLKKQHQEENPSKITRSQESEQDHSQKEKTDNSCQTKEEDDDAKTQRKNYLQVKRHLQEALDANREWEKFARQKREEYEKSLSEAKAAINALEEKVRMAECSSSDASRQLDSILNATENQASQIEKENVKLRKENQELRDKLQRMTEEKRKVEKFSKDLLKGKPGVESNLIPTRRDKGESKTGRIADIPPPTSAEVYRHGDDGKYGALDSYRVLMEKVRTQARPPPDVFEGSMRQKTSRPENVKAPDKQAKKVSSTADDIMFLKAQVMQYQEDFQRERSDRERAASELESMRRQLEETKMLLAIQRDEFPAPKAHKVKSSSNEREREERRREGRPIRYLDPDQVSRLRNQAREQYRFEDDY